MNAGHCYYCGGTGKGRCHKACPICKQRLLRITERRAKLESDKRALERDVRALVASKSVPVAEVAKALGVTRQRVYQLAGR